MNNTKLRIMDVIVQKMVLILIGNGMKNRNAIFVMDVEKDNNGNILKRKKGGHC